MGALRRQGGNRNRENERVASSVESLAAFAAIENAGLGPRRTLVAKKQPKGLSSPGTLARPFSCFTIRETGPGHASIIEGAGHPAQNRSRTRQHPIPPILSFAGMGSRHHDNPPKS